MTNPHQLSGTVLFDFDSTLISGESLDLFFQAHCDNAELCQQLEQITAQGMNGEVKFADSLTRRIALLNTYCAQPDSSLLAQFHHFSQQTLTQCITNGMAELIARLQQKFAVWIISGGLTPLILPVAKQLNIAADRVAAVQVEQTTAQQPLQIINANGFASDKITGLQKLIGRLAAPITIIGDGFTDFALYQQGLAQHFIAYCEHVTRPSVIENAPLIASNSQQLHTQLKTLLGVDL